MSWRADPPPGARGRRPVAAPVFAILVLACLLAGGQAIGQSIGQAVGQAAGDATEQPAAANAAQDAGRIDSLLERASRLVADAETPTETLESLREELARERSATRASEAELTRAVAEVRSRLDALGPAPAEGETEPSEVAALRRQIGNELAAAQVPLVVAQQAAERAETLIGQIDRIARGRISAELFGHGPSPLLPATWTRAATEIGARVEARVSRLDLGAAASLTRAEHLGRLLFDAALLVAGIALTLALRGRINTWIERRLAAAVDPRSVAWIVALRNLNRLVVPTVGAALLLAAVEGGGIAERLSLGGLLALPAWVMVLIASGWLSGSLFAPSLAAHRVAPVATPDAVTGSRLVIACGLALAAIYALRDLVAALNLSADSRAVLAFPLVVIAAILIWRCGRFIDLHAPAFFAAEVPAAEDGPTGVGLPLLRLFAQGLRAVAMVAPILAATGFVVLAGFLVVAPLLTVGLLGAGVVVNDVAGKTAESLLGRGRREGDLGLIPVAVGFLVILAGLPLLALIWGARATDIRDTWDVLAQGVAVGGITISINVVVKFLLAFALIVLVTRVIQSVLVGTVLPRTRLDVGAREAARAGVGYVGYALAILAGISAAGLDLSSLAIVAGALSVGIGFGLQTIVSNFVSGIILLVERPIKPGDWIEVGTFSGYVRGIRVRSTEIETFDRATVIIPNSDLIAGTVLNRTHIGMAGRLILPVGVAYDSDPREVERILLEVADQHPVVLDDPPPAVIFMGMGENAINFELRCRLRDVNFSLTVRSDMNFTIFERFREAGIVFPYAHRVVQIVGSAPEDKPA